MSSYISNVQVEHQAGQGIDFLELLMNGGASDAEDMSGTGCLEQGEHNFD